MNHLASPFPQIGELGWMSPWYGGVMPAVVARHGEQFPGKLGRHTFSAAPTEERDEHGLAWRGVRQRTTLDHDDLGGLMVEFDTLTLGASPVVKLVLRLHNPAPVGYHGLNHLHLAITRSIQRRAETHSSRTRSTVQA